MQKGFAPILILVGILVLTAVAGGAYYFGKSQVPKSQTQNQVIISKTIPSVAPTSTPTISDETANWKTDAKFGYEIKYPQNSVITNFSPDTSVPDLVSATSIEINGPLFFVYVYKNLGIDIIDAASRDQWCNLLQKELIGQLECKHGGNLPMVQVNGYSAYQATGGRDNTLAKIIYIPHNDYVYELTVTTGDIVGNKFSILDQVLATFKFTQ